ncbi:propionyl-CoA carboxylase regulator [Novosphingobium colocasiae]|uniref:Propionyl-CoA carboxylase regulator n=2 Tax=Novosphingobium colocasiae TaxID=1256513 RepID=A0A918UK62_9SPHN|nr:propionyl-CoA carboxylase regulator [Novosphingobium colocasiae]
MAALLQISPAYLSQLENDDRPLSPALIDRLNQKFPIEWQDILQRDVLPLQTRLQQALSTQGDPDPVTSTQIRRISEQFPEFAEQFIHLNARYHQELQRLSMLDEAVGVDQSAGGRLPWEEVRDWFHNANNYVDILDQGAEDIHREVSFRRSRMAVPEMTAWLTARDVRVVYQPGAPLRKWDADRRTLTLDPMQSPETIRFHLAWQISSIAFSKQISEIAESSGLLGPTSRDLLEVGLGNYAAGAMILPYRQFRDQAQRFRHDVDRLAWEFSASFEQVCHRLSTLQRPGARGLPVFFFRIDLAGNITKRHSATRLQFARFGGSCPLWVAHEAVAVPERIHVQLAEMPDGVRYVSMARGIVKSSGSFQRLPRRYAVSLGCEIEFARDFVYADGINLTAVDSAVSIGVSCRICPRLSCDQRAYPPSDRNISINADRRGIVPYDIVN